MLIKYTRSVIAFQNLDSKKLFILLDPFIHSYCESKLPIVKKDTVRSLPSLLPILFIQKQDNDMIYSESAATIVWIFWTSRILTEMNYKDLVIRRREFLFVLSLQIIRHEHMKFLDVEFNLRTLRCLDMYLLFLQILFIPHIYQIKGPWIAN